MPHTSEWFLFDNMHTPCFYERSLRPTHHSSQHPLDTYETIRLKRPSGKFGGGVLPQFVANLVNVFITISMAILSASIQKHDNSHNDTNDTNLQRGDDALRTCPPTVRLSIYFPHSCSFGPLT